MGDVLVSRKSTLRSLLRPTILCSPLFMYLCHCISHLRVLIIFLFALDFVFCMLRKLDLCFATASMITPLKIYIWTLFTNTNYTIWIDATATANAMLAPLQMSFSLLPLSPYYYTNDKRINERTKDLIDATKKFLHIIGDSTQINFEFPFFVLEIIYYNKYI